MIMILTTEELDALRAEVGDGPSGFEPNKLWYVSEEGIYPFDDGE